MQTNADGRCRRMSALANAPYAENADVDEDEDATRTLTPTAADEHRRSPTNPTRNAPLAMIGVV
jgi:hypothetical protein